jgi:hypothetical protein
MMVKIMSRKKSVNEPNKGNYNSTLIIVAVIGLVGTVITAYFGFRANIAPTEISINATKTAESESNITVSTQTSFPVQMQTISPNVYIANWSGATLYPGDTLIMWAYSCIDPEQYSSHGGAKPAYWIIYETWITLTFVNSQDTPNGIISIEPIYKSEYERNWKMRTWYVTMYETGTPENPVSLPVDLPPKTPRKWYFRAVRLAETYPEQGTIPVIDYGNTLSPLSWAFNIVNNEQVVHSSDLYVSVDEAVDDGKLEFTKKCNEILPDWPNIPLPGRGIP